MEKFRKEIINELKKLRVSPISLKITSITEHCESCHSSNFGGQVPDSLKLESVSYNIQFMIILPPPEYVFKPLGWLGGLIKAAWSKIRKPISIPKETLRIVPQPNQLRWSPGKDKAGNQIAVASCKFFITNITHGPIIIADSYLKKPQSSHAHPMLIEDYKAYAAATNPLPPGETTELECTYAIKEGDYKKGESIKAEAVVVDQLGNQHVCKKLELNSI